MNASILSSIAPRGEAARGQACLPSAVPSRCPDSRASTGRPDDLEVQVPDPERTTKVVSFGTKRIFNQTASYNQSIYSWLVMRDNAVADLGPLRGNWRREGRSFP